MQTLVKVGGESRKSSTCHPGIVSIKYSDILLELFDPLLDPLYFGTVLILVAVFWLFWFRIGAETRSWPPDLGFWSGTTLVSMVGNNVAWDNLTPVCTNQLWFIVCSFTLWIATSQSLHSIALSCWQNNKPFFSCKNDKIFKNIFYEFRMITFFRHISWVRVVVSKTLYIRSSYLLPDKYHI